MSEPTSIRAFVTGRLIRDPQMPGPAVTGGAARMLVQALSADGAQGPVARLKATDPRIVRFLGDMRPVKGDSLMATGVLDAKPGEEPWLIVDTVAFATSMDQKDET